jgi:hypothetical protein
MYKHSFPYVRNAGYHKAKALSLFAEHFTAVELNADLDAGWFHVEVRGVMTRVKVKYDPSCYLYCFYTPGMTKELLGLVGYSKKNKCLAKTDLKQLAEHVIWRQQKSYLPGGY